MYNLQSRLYAVSICFATAAVKLRQHNFHNHGSGKWSKCAGFCAFRRHDGLAGAEADMLTGHIG